MTASTPPVRWLRRAHYRLLVAAAVVEAGVIGILLMAWLP